MFEAKHRGGVGKCLSLTGQSEALEIGNCVYCCRHAGKLSPELNVRKVSFFTFADSLKESLLGLLLRSPLSELKTRRQLFGQLPHRRRTLVSRRSPYLKIPLIHTLQS